MSTRITKSLSIAALAASLAACSSVPLDQAGSGSGTGGDGAATGQIMDPFNPQSPLAQQTSVYFEYDSYVVPEQYRSVVEMHSSYLSGNGQQKVRIEGHADARGGSEYNLALGQRRSDVRTEQIETISFGKERPRALGNTEADYAENRRADFNYQR
jgi:peptidoglycan-associated lipoprotein